MRNSKPSYCGPLGSSVIRNTYVEDKVSGGFFVLNAEHLTLSMPVRYGDDEINEHLLLLLIAEVIDWMGINRTDKTLNWPPPAEFTADDPMVTTDFRPGSYEDSSQLTLIQDEISRATVTATPTLLTITMPIVSEDSFFFVNEHRLMRLVSEALEILSSYRSQRSRDLEISNEKPNVLEAAD